MKTMLASIAVLLAWPALAQAQDKPPAQDQEREKRMEELKKRQDEALKRFDERVKAARERIEKAFKERGERIQKGEKPPAMRPGRKLRQAFRQHLQKRAGPQVMKLRRDLMQLRRDIERLRRQLQHRRGGERRGGWWGKRRGPRDH